MPGRELDRVGRRAALARPGAGAADDPRRGGRAPADTRRCSAAATRRAGVFHPLAPRAAAHPSRLKAEFDPARHLQSAAGCTRISDARMQTNLADFIKDTPEGREADAILRKCVHCGFCTATCPTYQLLGDELDGPRGRIYLIKQVLEGAEADAPRPRLHLDRCLTCRACETTCPSGVKYGRLRRHRPQGRRGAGRSAGRGAREAARGCDGAAATGAVRPGHGLGRLARPFLPAALRDKVPARRRARAAGRRRAMRAR